MTVVYTAILGTCDSLKPAPTGADRCVCFVDDVAAYPDAKGWELVAHAYTGDPRREAWRLRCVPETLFPTYNRVVWIDASFTLTELPRLIKDAGYAPAAALRHHARRSPYDEARKLVEIGQSRTEEVARQMLDYYTAAGFRPTHLSISCVIVRDHSDKARQFGQTWDEQIRKYPGDNTQVSLDYSAWASGFEIRALRGTRHQNPYATHDHADHKRRRQPYQQAVNA